ncbi:hypothetical protein AB4Y40_40275 [Paraburkholderia sp. EG287B]|uniref:hypothetical protein n=1 Tax=Paraburkholderia sp. EG287B TaxID=3237010 RepID=UPI0034D27817
MAKPDYAAMVKQLNLTPQEVVDAIDDLNEWVCLHDKFVTLQQTIMNAVAGRSRDLLIFDIGPARVGKTTLFESIAGMTDELARKAGKKRGCFRFSVPPPDNQGRFNWTIAITEAYVKSDEILPFSKIAYGDIAEGAPRHRPVTASVSKTDREKALWQSFVKNIQLEKLFLIVDEGNTIPVTLTPLQVARAITAFKYIVGQTGQPLLIGGTSDIRQIIEHDTQMKVRTMVLRQDAYGDNAKDKKNFHEFMVQMEVRLGPKFCEPGSLSSRSDDIRAGLDGRCGLAVRAATDALSQFSDKGPLKWPLYQTHVIRLEQYAGRDLALEREKTNAPIIANAEAPTTKKVARNEKAQRNGRVGATKNTNAPNHPFE